MFRWISLSALFALACTGAEVTPEPTPEPEPIVEPAPEPVAAKGVDFGNDLTGELTSPVHVVMTVAGMEVEPAGAILEGKGHHHIIIDGEPVPTGTIVPSDEHHIHFGAGQTETDVAIEPGTHTLTLQFANGMHESYGPEWSATTTITVVAPAAE